MIFLLNLFGSFILFCGFGFSYVIYVLFIIGVNGVLWVLEVFVSYVLVVVF